MRKGIGNTLDPRFFVGISTNQLTFFPWGSLRLRSPPTLPSRIMDPHGSRYGRATILTFGTSSPMASTSRTDFPSTVGSPDFGTPKHRALRQPPSFMADPADPQSLDHLVRSLTEPKALKRPTIQQILRLDALQWVASRRLCPATVYEGTWGPELESIGAFDCDVQMIDI
jgi:hypothetical protein